MNSSSSPIEKPNTSIDSLYMSSSSTIESLVGFIFLLYAIPNLSLLLLTALSFLQISDMPNMVLFNAFSYFLSLFLSFFYYFSAYSIYNGMLLAFLSSSLSYRMSSISSKFYSIFNLSDRIRLSLISKSSLCLCFISFTFFLFSSFAMSNSFSLLEVLDKATLCKGSVLLLF